MEEKVRKYAIVFKDYKAGVVDENGNVLIPFIYDEIYNRYKLVPNENRRRYVDDDGEEQFFGPEKVPVCRGYACFTNEGGEQAYDEDCNPCEFDEVDAPYLYPKYEWCVPENVGRSLEEIEAELKATYHKLQKLRGCDDYRYPEYHDCTEEEERLESIVRGHIYDRRHVMNMAWVHNKKNADRISRTNDLLMRAVKKAVKLGKKTMKSLKWMDDVPNGYLFEIEVYVHPEWENDKSSYEYKRPYGVSRKKENERLKEQEYEEADFHVWNIIAAMGEGGREDGVALCFEHIMWKTDDKWNFKELVMDDGVSWDEGIRYPAYMDVYFTHPFHQLSLDSYSYSFDDLCNINDFRVNVKVKMEAKEQDR